LPLKGKTVLLTEIINVGLYIVCKSQIRGEEGVFKIDKPVSEYLFLIKPILID